MRRGARRMERPIGTMIICSCNVLSDAMVRTWLAADPQFCWTVTEMYRCLGCAPKCGRCVRAIRDIIATETGDARPGWARGAHSRACGTGDPQRGDPRAREARECEV